MVAVTPQRCRKLIYGRCREIDYPPQGDNIMHDTGIGQNLSPFASFIFARHLN